MSVTVLIDGLEFELRRSRRRRTVAVIIHRDGSLALAAPLRYPLTEIHRFAREKRPWIDKKLAGRQELLARRKERRFGDGEEFPYLGRNHRLKLFTPLNGQPPLRLCRGLFLLDRDERANGRDHFVRWYAERASNWIGRRIEGYEAVIGVRVKDLRIRGFRSQWGSCRPDGTVSLDWRAILLPPRIVEYVLLHELAHLRQPNHKPAFWRLMERIMPDYAERRKWLRQNGAVADI